MLSNFIPLTDWLQTKDGNKLSRNNSNFTIVERDEQSKKNLEQDLVYF